MTVVEPSQARSIDPRLEYGLRLARSKELAGRLARRDNSAGNTRLVLFLVLGVLGFLAWRGDVGIVWPILVAGAFVVLVIVHGGVVRARKRAEGVSAFHERGLARLDGKWAGSGVSGERFLDEEHPYAADLDLFGVGSMFERLCSARTSAGEATLASWLLKPAAPSEIRARHEAVAELRGRLDLREDLALLGDDVRSGVAPEALAGWGATPHRGVPFGLRMVLVVVAVATVAALVARLAEVAPTWPLMALIVVEIAIAYGFSKRAGRAVADVEERSGDLVTLAGLLARIERERFDSPRLKELRETLDREGMPASRRIGKLAGLVRWLEARHNVYFALFGSILLWKTQFALAIEAWRGREGASIAGWLDVVGQFEAYASLASYSFENPDDPFPEIVEEGPCFTAEVMGHPLLQGDSNVRNSLSLGGDLRVLAVSGSNMSGKSTWLRTVGINAVLAQAGATVKARRLRISPLTIGGTLRVHDSLQAGRSRFYAEILRIRQLVDLSKQSPPLLFLIDEVFNGTNSADRLLGAQAVVRGLVDRGAIGLFTTHDLTLAEIAEKLAPRAINVHFADQLDDQGKLTFDYTMRPGVVRQSNALALMRAVGLEV